MKHPYATTSEFMAKAHSNKSRPINPQVANTSDVEEIFALNQQFDLPIRPFRWTTKEWIFSQVDEGNYFVTRDRRGCSSAMCLNPDKLDPRVLWVQTIAVRTSLQKQGYGRALLNYASEKALQGDFDTVKVGTCKIYNLTNFYESCGFKFYSERKKSIFFRRDLDPGKDSP